MLKPILVAFLYAYSFVYSFAQPLQFRTLNVKDGLSQGYISSLFQDSRGFVWIGTAFGLNRYDGYECRAYLPNNLDQWSLHANLVFGFAEDKTGLLWMGTENGLAVMDPYTDRVVHLNALTKEVADLKTRKVLVDGNGKIWFSQETPEGTKIYAIETDASLKNSIRNNLKTPYRLRINVVPLPADWQGNLRLLFQTSDSTAIIANAKGLFYNINLLNKSIQPVAKTAITSILPGQSFLLENATHTGGVFIPANVDFSNPMAIDHQNEYFRAFDEKTILLRFSDTKVYEINKVGGTAKEDGSTQLSTCLNLDQTTSFARMLDRNGNIWVGTTGDGIRIISPASKIIQSVFQDVNVYNLTVLPDGKVWPGLYQSDRLLDLPTHQSSATPWLHTLLKGETVQSVLSVPEENAIYLVINQKGQKLLFARYDLTTRKTQRLTTAIQHYTEAPLYLIKDQSGCIWVAGYQGDIIRYNPQTGASAVWNIQSQLPAKSPPSLFNIRCMVLDHLGNIWIGNDAGLIKISQQGLQPDFKAYYNDTQKSPLFRSNGIFCIYPDPADQQILWLGTLGSGLAQFNIARESVHYVEVNPSKANLMILGIVPDDNNNLWLSTNQGIFCFKPGSNTLFKFNAFDLNFNASAYGKINNNLMVYGSSNGIITANPRLLEQPKNQDYQVCFTNIKVNSALDKHSEKRITLFTPNNEPVLYLSHLENALTIGFSAPASQNPSDLLYRYRILGITKNWVELGNLHVIELVGLQPGQYTLEIQGSNTESNWNEAAVTRAFIHVSPPWFRSNWAYAAYLLLLVLALYSLYQLDRKRLIRQHENEMNIQELSRLKKIDSFKNRFFAYIAHEFKSPLTIILGINELINNSDATSKPLLYHDAIRREGNNMLTLIDEMVDVTKIQDNSIQLHYEKIDVVPFVRHFLEAYKPITDTNNIILKWKSPLEALMVDLDTTRTKYIMNNLISNAIRFTPSGGSISVLVDLIEPQTLALEITDTGTGISEYDLPRIFDKYYQADTGSKQAHSFGLGLSFVKDLVDLMQGGIAVTSTVSQGTTFTITLPIQTPSLITPIDASNHIRPQESEEISQELPQNHELPLLMVVEDNPAILSYLQICLQTNFRLIIARNGAEGFKVAISEIPDLILTDIIMPIMDGLEMTHQIKTHQMTSHIPVVMLSAKNEVNDRIIGQQQGADAYLGKPFNDQVLLHTLQNLYALQQRWKERYAPMGNSQFDLSQASALPENFSATSVSYTDAFMQAVLNAIEENYASDQFDTTRLCNILGISRAQLYRKFTKISDQSVMEILRNYRLEKSVELLKNHPALSTQEIAYRVGIKEHSHFSLIFKKRYNMTPSEMRKTV